MQVEAASKAFIDTGPPALHPVSMPYMPSTLSPSTPVRPGMPEMPMPVPARVMLKIP